MIYARATRLPEESKGYMRLAQKSVEVNVIGQEKIGKFTVDQPGAYILIHEQDLKLLLENTKELQELKKKEK